MPEAGIERLLGRPGLPAIVRVRHPHCVERLGHRHVAAGGVLGQVRGDPAHDDASGVWRTGWRDSDARGDRVAERVTLCDERARHGTGRHGRAGEDLPGSPERRTAVLRDVHPDLARAVEVVVHQHDLGLRGALP